MRLAVDAAGPDPSPVLEGALRALRSGAAEIHLFGPRERLLRGLEALGAPEERGLKVLDVPEAAEPAPGDACPMPVESAVQRAAAAVARGEADAFVSAGKPGAAMAAAMRSLKRLPGVLRPALLVTLPTPRGPVALLDAGGSMGSKPWHLLQYALMGALFAEAELRREKPTVGLLSAALESGSVDETLREALSLLKYSGLNFIGPVEGDALASGGVDVAVCDGALGDVCSKLVCGTAAAVLEAVEPPPAGSVARLAARIAAPGSGRARTEYDCARSRSAAPLLGVDGTAVVCRAPATPEGVEDALRMAASLSERRLQDRIRERIEAFKSNVELSRISE